MLKYFGMLKTIELPNVKGWLREFDLREYLSIIKFIFRRLAMAPVLLAGLSFLIFGLFSMLSPFERAALYVRDIPKRQVEVAAIVEKYQLDAPLHVQYWNWLMGTKDPDTGEVEGGILRGQLGWSKTGRSTVAEVLSRRFPASAELVLWSIVPTIGLSIWMGVKAAANHNKVIDQVLRLTAITGWSIPSFVIGLLLLMVFYSGMDMFPPGRLSREFTDIVLAPEFVQYTKMHTIDALLNFRLDVFVDALRHLVLPVITLSVVNWAFLLRITRSAMLDTLRQDYITTAWSKGLPRDTIINKHALRNALIPVVTINGLTLIGLFNSVVITETVFNFPGIGSFMAASLLDAVSLMGATLVISFILIVVNLIVDVLYGILDPRIRLEQDHRLRL